MAIYDKIGRSYTQTRIPDPRIAAAIAAQITSGIASGSASDLTIADIGAGTGNYSNLLADLGHRVWAVEPSGVMRSQAKPHANVVWHEGVAEQLPLQSDSVDAVISQLSLHHFSDRPRALWEMVRVVKPGGCLVLFTFDIRQCEPFWLLDYFPLLREDALKLPPLSQIVAELESVGAGDVTVVPFELPVDLSDLFAAAAWRRPELYLKPEVIAGISSLAKLDDAVLQPSLEWLAADLASGVWERRYGAVLGRDRFDAGYRMIRVGVEA